MQGETARFDFVFSIYCSYFLYVQKDSSILTSLCYYFSDSKRMSF